MVFRGTGLPTVGSPPSPFCSWSMGFALPCLLPKAMGLALGESEGEGEGEAVCRDGRSGSTSAEWIVVADLIVGGQEWEWKMACLEPSIS